MSTNDAKSGTTVPTTIPLADGSDHPIDASTTLGELKRSGITLGELAASGVTLGELASKGLRRPK
jgi:hypothetical protein